MSNTRANLQQLFNETDSSFQEKLLRIAMIAHCSVMQVYTKWHHYEKLCQSGDQSAVLHEFVGWFKTSFGGDLDALRNAIS